MIRKKSFVISGLVVSLLLVAYSLAYSTNTSSISSAMTPSNWLSRENIQPHTYSWMLDLNSDGKINVSDIDYVAQYFGQTNVSAIVDWNVTKQLASNEWGQGLVLWQSPDINKDGKVDGRDITLVAQAYGCSGSIVNNGNGLFMHVTVNLNETGGE
jgi:hypothetical protein